MAKSMKKLVAGLLLVGVLGLAVSKLKGGRSNSTDDDEIDRVTTEGDESAEIDADRDLPAASGALDAFDYLAIIATAAKAAYSEYRSRA